ncbi:hypothetical protein BABINDRAFT_160913 [Babjeviella inositovora NRRL Y-12698]|uniref:Protein farnesyltransferase subunit beta n=1 Tax=Babjeviella inositovora NRRL Y-12698 TaxID=984486 RepID=A0A1E3QSJ6_9ASCO|nr:uncharacterized protein BABINDRAFT_160913 [Babjeviella inositovora NRRL Y-12698]ODQ80675.1 hypothetical protein BABINDRAFT_160913 [Babjeviella inositovora NRRL Y-12698]
MCEAETTIHDTLETKTTIEKDRVQLDIKQIYETILELGEFPTLATKKHVQFLTISLGSLPHDFCVLDASNPWILYWILNSLLLLRKELNQKTCDQVREKIMGYIHPEGGIGGGPGQTGHAAATYASILSLTLTKNWDVMRAMKNQIYPWLLTLKQADGSFVMHVGGEKDTRAVYCVLTVASLLDVMTPELVEGTGAWLKSCQTYEGGFGGIPFDEAHGGYTFCAVASLCLLGHPRELSKHCNIDSLTRWVVSRQYTLEGGLSGRTNKLVDGCYSHWVGTVGPLLEVALGERSIINRPALQHYILSCCQFEKGGLRDKPGMNADFYHTNYVLCGLATVQTETVFDEAQYCSSIIDSAAYCFRSVPARSDIVEVEQVNLVRAINPIFGIPDGFPEACRASMR